MECPTLPISRFGWMGEVISWPFQVPSRPRSSVHPTTSDFKKRRRHPRVSLPALLFLFTLLTNLTYDHIYTIIRRNPTTTSAHGLPNNLSLADTHIQHT